MRAFIDLEIAALHSIFAETPDLPAQLERQLASAAVTQRENSGGFFTTSVVDDAAPDVSFSGA